MMATDMKFGPEWLRALSDGGPNSSSTATPPTTPSAPKYKLAEYRYGREEMLALFSHNLKPPENIEEFPHLYVDKMQFPLALTNMSEEEVRLWNRVNSDVVLRLVGKPGTGPERGERTINERGGLSIRAGRGGSLSERGRGRGRGYYQRNNYDDSGDSPPERRDFRTRPFERNHSLNEENSRDKKFERSFSRGGGNGGGEDNALLSKRGNSRSSSVENWRTGGRGEDREGWRTARGSADNWNRNNSWRSGERDKDYDHEMDNSERNGPQHRKYNNYHKNPNDLWDDIEENDRRNSLPEWSLDDGPEQEAKVGTFDASGAFREDNADDDEDNKELEEEFDDNKREEHKDSNSEQNSKKTNQNLKSVNNEFQKETKNEKSNQNLGKVVKKDETNGSRGSSNTNQNQPKPQISQKGSHLGGIQSQPTQPSSQMPSNSINKLFKTNDSLNSNPNSHNIKSPLEEDGFAHLEKEAENMVAQWTADDEHKDKPEVHTQEEQSKNNIIVLSVQHEDAFKWFYRDPQNEIQGPFTPHEMYDWFTAGYFAMDLLVRRGCDDHFCQLGELFKLWDRIPFIQVQGSTPPPLRSNSSVNPLQTSHPLTSSQPSSHSSAHSMTVTAPQHLIHPQLATQASHPTPQPQSQSQPMFLKPSVDMQSQLRLLLAQLKKQEGFSDLSQQQQQEVLVQRYVHLEQQRQQSLQTSIPNTRSADDSQMSTLDALSNLRIQNTRPLQVVNPSIWDINPSALSVSAIEEMQRKEQEMKELEERRKAYEESQNRKKLELQEQEIQRKMNEERERKFEELQKKLEEERLRNQELLRKQEDEKRRREEEERMRLEEEERRLSERAAEEQKRRHEELMRLEEYARRQSLQEDERRRQMEIEKDRQRQQLQEIERERVKEIERIRQIQQHQHQQQQHQQQEALIKLQQQQQEKQRKGPVWGGQEVQQKQQNNLSLDDIQRLQEEKDREERQRQLQQKHMQALFAAQQQQQNKQALTWATTQYQQQNAPVKTLAEIQREEAEKVAKQRIIDNKKQQIQVTNTVPNAGIWTNANNQLFGQTVPSKPPNSSAPNNSVPIGFWEPESRKVPTNRANESALHSMQSNSKGNNNNNNNTSTQFQTKSNSRNKKEEETVLRLFENQRRQKTDEFTQWCNEALSKYQSSVDIPTFIAFLKDVESPFEINDYVRSYLGETKDVKEFAKQFIEKRSYFRNQAKREASEELMWGPAPAITPSANKLTQNSSSALNSTQNSDSDTSGFIQAGKKKKRGKRVIDNSILGFTVQADPDRINAGEIEQIDD